MSTATTERPHAFAVDAEQVKPNDVLAIVRYVHVKDASPDLLTVVDARTGDELEIEGRELIESAFSADQYQTTEMVSREQMNMLLQTAGDKPFTATFVKKEGELRTLRGYYIRPCTGTDAGRSLVRDLDAIDEDSTGFRKLDNRTIEELIVNGIKYSLKK